MELRASESVSIESSTGLLNALVVVERTGTRLDGPGQRAAQPRREDDWS